MACRRPDRVARRATHHQRGPHQADSPALLLPLAVFHPTAVQDCSLADCICCEDFAKIGRGSDSTRRSPVLPPGPQPTLASAVAVYSHALPVPMYYPIHIPVFIFSPPTAVHCTRPGFASPTTLFSLPAWWISSGAASPRHQLTDRAHPRYVLGNFPALLQEERVRTGYGLGWASGLGQPIQCLVNCCQGYCSKSRYVAQQGFRVGLANPITGQLLSAF